MTDWRLPVAILCLMVGVMCVLFGIASLCRLETKRWRFAPWIWFWDFVALLTSLIEGAISLPSEIKAIREHWQRSVMARRLVTFGFGMLVLAGALYAWTS